MTQIAGCVVCIIFSNFYASAVFVISMVCINGFSLNFLSAVHTATKVYWLGFGVKRSKTKMSAWPNMLKIPFLVCFHGISGVCWLLFSELLSLMHLGTKMNCLDLEVKRSKVMVQAWPYVLKLTKTTWPSWRRRRWWWWWWWQSHILCLWCSLGGITVRASDLRSSSRGFNSRSGCCQVTS